MSSEEVRVITYHCIKRILEAYLGSASGLKSLLYAIGAAVSSRSCSCGA